MNRTQLIASLKSLGVRDDAYSLDGTRDEAYCLDHSSAGWTVYYSERGLKSGMRLFASESEACEYLKLLLSTDGSAN